MLISTSILRLTPRLTLQRTCLLNIHKASSKLSSRHSVCNQILRQINVSLRFRSDLVHGGKDKLDIGSQADSSSMKEEEASLSSTASSLSPPRTITETVNNDGLTPSMTSRYKLFEKSEEELILDYSEELAAEENPTDWPSDEIHFPYRKRQSKFDQINLERGKEAVIDVEELVNLLHEENMSNIIVLGLPSELRYADYMIIVSAKSVKQLKAVTEFLVQVWKLKKHVNDRFLSVEGENSPDWKVLDMDSIVLHIFMPETREKYDLESLWSLGAQYDDYTQKPAADPVTDILEKHIHYLQNLKPTELPIRRADMIPISIRPGTMTRQKIRALQREIIKSKSQSTREPDE